MTTEIVELTDGLLRLRAPNPGPMTFSGTNSYLLRGGSNHGLSLPRGVAVIDPGGPEDAAHLDAILRALTPPYERITHIFVTHAHLDHSPPSPARSPARRGGQRSTPLVPPRRGGALR